MSERNFFAELKRRNVYKVAAAYAVVAWLLIQLASILFPTFEAPPWVMKVFVALVVLGFPLALIFAWAFELTPEGIKRTEDVEPNESLTRRTGRKLMAGVAVVAVIAAGLFAFQLLRPASSVTADRKTAGSADIPEKSIAVLPFENLSDDKSNAYFADGIQDQILTKLASVADLKVISRTSTVKYKSQPEDLKTVSRELGVATVLEGTVQRAGDRVRVNVQLIDARVDSHLWAKNYDRELKDVFAVQSEISQEIADALQAKLSPKEAGNLAVAPTRNPDAYDLFLKAEYEYRQGDRLLTAESYDRAAAYYREALARDPQFALAAAGLARSKLARHWNIGPISADELAEAKTLAERAVALAPDNAETHLALGFYYYWGQRQYDLALREFQTALELQPNSAAAHSLIGYVYRRQGRWEQSTAELLKATELDPRDAELPANIAGSYVTLRQWSDAQRAARRALAIDPQSAAATNALGFALINGDGNVDAAERIAAALPPGVRIATNWRGTAATMIGPQTYLPVLKRDFHRATQELERFGPGNKAALPAAARCALRLLAGDAAGASAAAEEARPALEANLGAGTDDALILWQLSWVYLAQQRNGDALRAMETAAAAVPVELDAQAGQTWQAGLAEIQARAGQSREAVRTLRHLLAIPAGAAVSINRLKLDPVWDPIRNDPEFQQLLAGKEQIGPNR